MVNGSDFYTPGKLYRAHRDFRQYVEIAGAGDNKRMCVDQDNILIFIKFMPTEFGEVLDQQKAVFLCGERLIQARWWDGIFNAPWFKELKSSE